jgi:hypothetical protein
VNSVTYVFGGVSSCLYSLCSPTTLYYVYAGSVYTGVEFSKRLCGISVIRRYQLFLKKIFHVYTCLGSNRVNDFGTHNRRKENLTLYSISVISLCRHFANDLLQLLASGESMENAL